MCGICGTVTSCALSPTTGTTTMLSKLRHRGFDSWGIGTLQAGSEIFIERSATSLQLSVNSQTQDRVSTVYQVGHTRYTTQGSHECIEQAQPMKTPNSRICLVHNGQVRTPPPDEFTAHVGAYGSDTEYLLDVLEEEFNKISSDVNEMTLDLMFRRMHIRLDGSYACIALIADVGLIAFRDPRGIKPLVMCVEENKVMFASESCAFPNTAPTTILDILPGQYCWVDMQAKVHIGQSPSKYEPELCLFEYIYLAHDDSVIDGISVRAARERLGRELVPLIKTFMADNQLDVLVPVPHTPVLAGRQICCYTSLEYVELLNVVSKSTSGSSSEDVTSLERRESRTFILPTSTAREHAVKQKFAINPKVIERCRNKNILLLDDSIVRGTTLKHIVRLIRDEVQPSKIYVASLAPPIISPNRYGIDIPSVSQLITNGDGSSSCGQRVADVLGLDGPVLYQSLDVIRRAFGRDFEDSVFRELMTKSLNSN